MATQSSLSTYKPSTLEMPQFVRGNENFNQRKVSTSSDTEFCRTGYERGYTLKQSMPLLGTITATRKGRTDQFELR